LLKLRLGHFFAGRGNLDRRFGERILALLILGDIEEKTRVLEINSMLVPSIDDRLERRLLPEKRLRFVGVVPEIGLGCELAQFFDALLLGFDVKDASAKDRAALPGGSVALWFLPTSVLFLKAASEMLR
jgi:hypothetical protein